MILASMVCKHFNFENHLGPGVPQAGALYRYTRILTIDIRYQAYTYITDIKLAISSFVQRTPYTNIEFSVTGRTYKMGSTMMWLAIVCILGISRLVSRMISRIIFARAEYKCHKSDYDKKLISRYISTYLLWSLQFRIVNITPFVCLTRQ